MSHDAPPGMEWQYEMSHDIQSTREWQTIWSHHPVEEFTSGRRRKYLFYTSKAPKFFQIKDVPEYSTPDVEEP